MAASLTFHKRFMWIEILIATYEFHDSCQIEIRPGLGARSALSDVKQLKYMKITRSASVIIISSHSAVQTVFVKRGFK